MALQTSLQKIKDIARGDQAIQCLSDDDPLVSLVLNDVALWVDENRFGNFTEMAQRYAAAHFLAQANTNEGGKGPISSESIGGISQTFTLPYLNQKTVLAATQYGLHYLEIRKSVTYHFGVTGPK